MDRIDPYGVNDQIMDEQQAPMESETPQVQAETSTQDAPQGDAETADTRRAFLGGSARKIAYVSPVVLLFKPRKACAASSASGSS